MAAAVEARVSPAAAATRWTEPTTILRVPQCGILNRLEAHRV